MQRGVIQNRARAAQIRNFHNLRFGTITPTDIDGLIEYQDRLYILLEAKMKGAEMPYGQMLALTRVVDDLAKTKKSILILGTHETSTAQDIDMGLLEVEKFYFNGKWRSPRKKIRVLDAVAEFINRYAQQAPTPANEAE